MGRIAKRVAKTLNKRPHSKIIDLTPHLDAKRNAGELSKSIKGVPELIQQGHDPLHAVYISTQNLVSLVAEGISMFPALDPYAKIAGKSEDDYMPDGPPFSPLTRSYFTAWAFFDLQFGPDRETIGSCIEELGAILAIPTEMQDVIHTMTASRMGIYEHCGHQGSMALLQDIVDQKTYRCFTGSRYRGKKGQLWFIRLMPPFLGVGDYHVGFTTPYVLSSQRREWEDYLNRTVQKIPKKGPMSIEQSVELLFKYGLNNNYWNEYIFQSYYNSETTAIYLTGIPDQPESMPHSG